MTPSDYEKELREKLERKRKSDLKGFKRYKRDNPDTRLTKEDIIDDEHRFANWNFQLTKAELKGFQTGVELERKRILDLIKRDFMKFSTANGTLIDKKLLIKQIEGEK